MSAAMRLTSVRIFVDDLEKGAAFYEGVVGLTRTGTAPTAILFENSPSIVVEAADDDARHHGLLGRFTGVSFETEDAAALYSDLQAKRVPLHGPPERQYWGGIMLFADDPSGNTITFLQYPKSATNRGQ
jgi:catechol 2,3-dioxygenase-like lactoylglutathione lyase family enzyme